MSESRTFATEGLTDDSDIIKQFPDPATEAGMHLIIGIDSTELDQATAELIEKVKPAGFCLFARNISDDHQVKRLVRDLKSASKYRPIITIDQEGGTVDRLRRIFGPLPAAASLRNAADAEKLGLLVGEALAFVDIDMDFAPVVDLSQGENVQPMNGLYGRCFSDSPQLTFEMAESFIGGLTEYGRLFCLKHFPGLGYSSVDSHEELPSIDVDDETFFNRELMPFRQLIEKFPESSVMAAHCLYPELSISSGDTKGRQLPASLSQEFINGLLRNRLGFSGTVFTDDLEMGAILRNFGIEEAAELALNAGADFLAICAGRDNIIRAHQYLVELFERDAIDKKLRISSLTRILNLIKTIENIGTVPTREKEEIIADIATFRDELALS
jgi:beta-N-acetylhexosaminidase